MPIHRYTAFAALGMLLLSCTACSTLVGVDPALSSERRDALQRAMARPALAAGADAPAVVAQADVAMPLAAFSRWFAEQGAPRFGAFLDGTATVAGVAHTDLLIGTWNKVGDRRRIVFVDGNSAVEEITAMRNPQQFQYQVWNRTDKIGRYTDYAVCELAFSAAPIGTHIQWICAFPPKGWPDGWLMRSFFQNDYRQFMQSGLAVMGMRAIAETAK